jgi:hypothetical protein
MTTSQEQEDKSQKQKNEVSLRERYKLLIAARNFHYNNFNKWMTYFYVAIGALFVGYCNIASSANPDLFLEYILLILGYIVSILWYWSSKGYYYWNINFINLVNYYEKELLKFPESERVYFVFANKNTENNYENPIKGANISTSKISILFAFIVTFFWGLILLNKLITCCSYQCYCSIILQILLSAISIILLTVLIPKNFLKSNHKHFHDLKLELK